MEDKRVRFESAYYDEDDPNVPKYIKKLFAEGAPADFILIGATTRDPSEINPAIRSRCAEIFFEPLMPVGYRTDCHQCRCPAGGGTGRRRGQIDQ
jgi:ATP-dependent Lon protease